MKVIKRILICLLILLAYYLFFGSGKTYAYYVGQTGLNIIFDNLIQYDPSHHITVHNKEKSHYVVLLLVVHITIKLFLEHGYMK